MAYKYNHFIPQNIAPKGTKKIGVYNSSGERVYTIPLGRLTPINKEKLYSFGLVADIHLFHLSADWNPNPKFDNTLSYFESKGCDMCIVAGDLTQTGFYLKYNDNDATEIPHIDLGQMGKYKEICDKHNIPVYALSGNHECYYNQDLTNNLDLWKEYVGSSTTSYVITKGNELFILLGQPSYNKVVSNDDFVWFSELLEANKSKRCFVFVHSYIEEDSGDAGDFRENSIFQSWGTTNRTNFMNLLKQYPNTILFHGHSHIKFEWQKIDKNATYTEKNGFKSIHVPSLSKPRDIDAEDANNDGNYTPDDHSGAQGYIVDVYDDCIVLNGMDLINNKPIPLGVLKVDTSW